MILNYLNINIFFIIYSIVNIYKFLFIFGHEVYHQRVL